MSVPHVSVSRGTSEHLDWLGAGDQEVGAARWTALEAAVARIIPTDEDPGAREAGTLDYVLAAARDDPERRRELMQGADLLDQLARAAGVVDAFADLSPEGQDAVLRRLEAEGDPFFDRLVRDVMEGFYGDPRHGGNRDAVGWRLIGFPGPAPAGGYVTPLGWYDATVPRGEGS